MHSWGLRKREETRWENSAERHCNTPLVLELPVSRDFYVVGSTDVRYFGTNAVRNMADMGAGTNSIDRSQCHAVTADVEL